MNEFDWSRFTVRIPINSTVSKIFEYWNSSKGLEFWFLRKADSWNETGKLLDKSSDLEPGYTYTWFWEGWDDNTKEVGKILENNHKDKIKFSFGNAGNVAINIIKENKYTVLELIQDEIPVDEYSKHNYHVGCKTGWTFHIANLKSIIENGHDLRNKDMGLKNVINS